MTLLRVKHYEAYSLVWCSFLHLNRVILVILSLGFTSEIKFDRPPFRQSGRGQLQAQDGKLCERSISGNNGLLTEKKKNDLGHGRIPASS